MGLTMSKTEDAILARLSVNPGEVVPVSDIERLLYGEREYRPRSNVLQVYIARLRKAGHTIKVKRGVGYRLVVHEG